MADYLIDSDVLIWHLRGHKRIGELLEGLTERGQLGISVIARAEILMGMREGERKGTFRLLTDLETFPINTAIADAAAESIRLFRSRGITLQLPDALIGTTAQRLGIPLYTCNPRHFPLEGLDLRGVVA